MEEYELLLTDLIEFCEQSDDVDKSGLVKAYNQFRTFDGAVKEAVKFYEGFNDKTSNGALIIKQSVKRYYHAWEIAAKAITAEVEDPRYIQIDRDVYEVLSEYLLQVVKDFFGMEYPGFDEYLAQKFDSMDKAARAEELKKSITGKKRSLTLSEKKLEKVEGDERVALEDKIAMLKGQIDQLEQEMAAL